MTSYWYLAVGWLIHQTAGFIPHQNFQVYSIIDTVSQLNFPFPATALTPDNILKELKEVDWKTLCDTSYIYAGTFGGVLELP